MMWSDLVLEPERVATAFALVSAYVALCWRTAAVTRAKRAEFSQDREALAAHSQWPAVLVAFASQTGQAEALARDTSRMLSAHGFRVKLVPVELLDEATLAAHSHSLWMLSTTGEGDAPDHALTFVQQLLSRRLDLHAHHSLVLALGDREYTEYCRFGVQVHAWLQAQGASSDLVCVDNMERASLQMWQGKIQALMQAWLESAGEVGDLQSAQKDSWLLASTGESFTLARRTLLNPGSAGGELYQLDWLPTSGSLPAWESGDVLSLCVPAQPDRPRDYSIASIMQDGCLQLLVRKSLRADGSTGLASGWLCEGMVEGESLELAVRAQSSFRLGKNAERPLILIGNGSGLAGLLSHLKARIQAGRGDQWLIYGERHPQHDAICGEQLEQWVQENKLERLDWAWSRGTGPREYVQDVLLKHPRQLKQWLERGAAIYVCGSLQGMGLGVHQALEQVLGASHLQELMQAGRYRRDVY